MPLKRIAGRVASVSGFVHKRTEAIIVLFCSLAATDIYVIDGGGVVISCSLTENAEPLSFCAVRKVWRSILLRFRRRLLLQCPVGGAVNRFFFLSCFVFGFAFSLISV